MVGGAQGGRAALAVHGLEVWIGRVQICTGIDIELPEGSVGAVLGTNGSGKSTLLRAVSGVLPVRQGTVTLLGEDITNLSAEQRVRRGLLLVSGGRATFPSLTVDESLRLGAWTFRHDKDRVTEAVDQSLARFPRLAERRHQPAGTLSGGEQQLLALARALVAAPRVLLIDELTLGLAPAAADEVLATIGSLPAAGSTVLLVEQSVSRAIAVSEGAWFLERGEVRYAGPAAELAGRTDLLRPILLAPRGGSPDQP